MKTATGLIPDGWGYPSPVYVSGFLGRRVKKVGGFVWNGSQPATEADIARLLEWRANAQVDPGTLVGRSSKAYSTFYDRNFETQKIRL